MRISNKNKILSNKKTRLFLLLIIIFAVWTGVKVYGQLSDIKGLNEELLDLQKEEEKFLNIKAGLEKEELMLHNYDYIAEIAREYYFLSKPGEIIIISPKD